MPMEGSIDIFLLPAWYLWAEINSAIFHQSEQSPTCLLKSCKQCNSDSRRGVAQNCILR